MPQTGQSKPQASSAQPQAPKSESRPDSTADLQAKLKALEAENAALKARQPTGEKVVAVEKDGVVTITGKGGGLKRFVKAEDGTPVRLDTPVPVPGKTFAVESIETKPKKAVCKNVSDESEALRLHKLHYKIGSKVSCRAFAA